MNALRALGGGNIDKTLLSPKPRKKSLDLIHEKISNIRRGGKKVVVMGLCGGPSSGKSKIAEYYKRNIPHSDVIAEKGYFRTITRQRKLSNLDEPLIGDQSGYSQERKILLTELANPSSYDHDALIETILALEKGENVNVPVYDDATDSIIADEKVIDPSKIEIIILEGQFIFYNEKIRELIDVKLFSEVDDDVRLSRLILKENKFLNNNPNAIKIFFIIYKKYLKPSYDNFVDSCKVYANIIFPNYAINSKGEIEEDNVI